MHGIVKEYGGVVLVDSVLGSGTTFHVYLPLTSAPAQASVDRASVPRGQGERVMFVDDEPQLAAAALKMLQRLGYVPLTFQGPSAALEALQHAAGSPAVLVTDFTMPDMTGPEADSCGAATSTWLALVLVSGSVGALSEAELRRAGRDGGPQQAAQLSSPGGGAAPRFARCFTPIGA